MSLLEAKKREIYQVLVKHGGNKTKASSELGISIRNLRNLTNSDPYFIEFKHDSVEEIGREQDNKMSNQGLIERDERMSEVFDTKEVVTTLNRLMNKVTEEKCTAETVNAACNCASQITQLLKVHLDVERLRRRV